MATLITAQLDEFDDLDDDDPTLDRDGNGEHPTWEAWVKRARGDLDHIPTRRWTYLQIARRAREPEAARKKRRPRQHLLTREEYSLLVALVEYANRELRRSWPGVRRLAKLEGLSERKVRYLLRSMAEKGWIVRLPEPGARGGVSGNQFCVPAGALAPWFDGWTGPNPFAT